MSPYRTEVVAVTVPPRATKGSGPASKASTSQLQATSGSSGSAATASSRSAWIYATNRMVPFHASSPSGSNNRIRRPKASPSDCSATTSESGWRTSAPTAWLYGARRCGGRMGPTSISGRTRAAVIASTAARNSAGSAVDPDVVTGQDVSRGCGRGGGGAPTECGSGVWPLTNRSGVRSRVWDVAALSRSKTHVGGERED